MKNALQSALATNIHQPIQPPTPAPNDSTPPRLPPLAIGNIDLIGEIFSTSRLELDVDRAPGSGLQARHDRTFSVPFTTLHGTSADLTHGVPYLQHKRPFPM